MHLEAAIQAVHCDRARSGVTDWEALHTLYAALVRVAPSLGERAGRAPRMPTKRKTNPHAVTCSR
jgi:predicted RNA polymerase sigma factor